ncbi:YgaP family membrane protein [Natrinema salaciae]|uniref:Inner membrane protein YgaP-like transmembrane domain-containing protein n=1 Tax=Natrinema salaciae TaxID=1186196 RepID=A0A1H9GUV0_9EURY|nr:DUF2892 domain-containing protein [Natrinema salaciae]SEQ53773.1 Protein of unknown function [Natrinema salaciae]
MKKNVGGFDRVWRLTGGAILALVGIAALVGFVSIGVVPAAVMVVLGWVFFATGVVRRCVINRFLGIDTTHGEQTESSGMTEVSTKRPN